jgi:hypothetical protein
MQVGQCGNQETHAEVCAAGAGRSAPSLRGLTCQCVDSAVSIYSVPLKICQARPPQAYTEIFAAGAGGVKTVVTCVGAVAQLGLPIPILRNYIAARINKPLYT